MVFNNSMSNEGIRILNSNEDRIKYLKRKCHNALKIMKKCNKLEEIYMNRSLYKYSVKFLQSLPFITYESLEADMKEKQITRASMDEPFNQSIKFIKTTDDGNCLYNSTSICIIGSECLSSILRYLVIHVLVVKREYFNILISMYENKNFFYYVKKAIDGWGQDLHVQALSLVLSRPFYAYQMSNKETLGIMYHATNSTANPIYLHFLCCHWEAIVPITGANVMEKVPFFKLYPQNH